MSRAAGRLPGPEWPKFRVENFMASLFLSASTIFLTTPEESFHRESLRIKYDAFSPCLLPAQRSAREESFVGRWRINTKFKHAPNCKNGLCTFPTIKI